MMTDRLKVRFFPLVENDNNSLISRPEESQEYRRAWAVAGRHLQKIFDEKNTMENVPCNGFNWIRTEISSPSFDSMNFRYKNQIFSILIDFIDLAEDRYISKTTEEAKELQLKTCYDNNIIPCLFKIKSRNIQPATGGWNLFGTVSGKKINPENLANDKPISLSNWELSNWAISTVLQDLKSKEYKIISFTDVPGKAPNIWFEDKDSRPSWVQVKVNGKPETAEQINKTIMDRYKGFVANVSIVPANGQPAVYRSCPAAVGYDGLKPFVK